MYTKFKVGILSRIDRRPYRTSQGARLGRFAVWLGVVLEDAVEVRAALSDLSDGGGEGIEIAF